MIRENAKKQSLRGVLLALGKDVVGGLCRGCGGGRMVGCAGGEWLLLGLRCDVLGGQWVGGIRSIDKSAEMEEGLQVKQRRA